MSPGDVTPVSGTGVNAGLCYTLSPQTRVYGLYSWLDPDQGDRCHVLSLGFAQDFSLGP